MQDVHAFVRQGLLGPLISVEMRIITTQVQFRNPRHWLFSEQQAGGGILAWLGCHYIDLMRYLTGDEVVSVAAEVATRSGEDIDVEDTAVVALRYASGAVGSLHAGYMLALSGGGYHNKTGYDIYVALNGRLGRICYTGTGSPEATLYLETTHPAWAGAPRRTTHYTPTESAAYGGVAGELFVRAFLRSAQGQGAAPTTGEDAWHVARIVDAAYLSSRSGRRVKLAEP